MKIHFILLVLFCLVNKCFGQTHIKGKVKDDQQNLSFASVTLLAEDSSPVKTVTTDNSGEFTFRDVAPGYYIISSTVVGYSRFVSRLIPVQEDEVVLPDIILEKRISELNGVVIKAKKPLLEQQIDRLVVNVQSSTTSAGNTILDVLQKTPGIVINKQNNTIAMNGKAGVRVMINGKLLELPLDVVIQMLEGMSASNVEKLELITAPPAKYDAEGNAGIINIVLKGNRDFGTNGSFGLTLGAKWAENLGFNFNVNHRSKNFAYFIDYSGTKDHNLHQLNLTRHTLHNTFVQDVQDYSHRENTTIQQNLNSGLEFTLSDKTSLHFSITGYRRNWDMHAVTYDDNHVTIDSTISTVMGIHESNIWQSATAGIGLETKLNSKSNLSVNLDYLHYNNSNPSQYNDEAVTVPGNTTSLSTIDLKKTTPIHFVVGTADYQCPLSPSLLLELGFKATKSHLNNDVVVQRLENNVWTVDPSFTSYSTLNDEIGAGYTSVKWHATKQLQINAGLRYESTHTTIGTPTQKDLLNRKYNYLFPNLSIKKDFDKSRDLEFSYSRRITRPTYNDIAPFVFFWGPNAFSAGNTTLLPAISSTVKASYRVKRLIMSVQVSNTRNEIDFFNTETDSLGNLIYRSQNLDYSNSAGLTNSWSFNPASWWEVQTNLTAQYQVLKTLNLSSNVVLHGYGLNINITNSVRLPKDFSIEVLGIYQSTTLSGTAKYLPAGSLNVGIQKKLKNGAIKLAMDDILYTNNWRIKTNVPQDNLNEYFRYDFHTQFIRLVYTRNFGNNKLRSLQLKSASEEERARVTN